MVFRFLKTVQPLRKVRTNKGLICLVVSSKIADLQAVGGHAIAKFLSAVAYQHRNCHLFRRRQIWFNARFVACERLAGMALCGNRGFSEHLIKPIKLDNLEAAIERAIAAS